MHSTYPPWPMMLVCRRWHDIVISTPALWSTFIAIFYGCSVSEMKHVPRMFDAHLRFSRRSPLTLCFYLATERWARMDSLGVTGRARTFDADYTSPTEVMTVLLEKARAHQYRWKHFSVRVDTVQSTDTPLWLMEVDNDPIQLQLKHLKMGARLDTPGPYASHQTPPPLNLPPYRGLETLQITGPFAVSVGSAGRFITPLSFPSLRVIRFECYDSMSLVALWKIFQESPSLEEVHLNLQLHFPSIAPAITIPSLKHLRLSAKLFDGAMTVLSRMRLPSLVRLDLSNVPFWDQYLRRLAEVLSTCNAPLQTFSLYVYGSPFEVCMEPFGEVLKSMPQLECLELAWRESDPAICLPASMHRALATLLRQERGTFLPSLTRLTIDTDIDDMLKRPSSAACLRDLIVACRKKFQSSPQRFSFGITSNASVCENLSSGFASMLLRDPAIGDCNAADNFEVLLKFR